MSLTKKALKIAGRGQLHQWSTTRTFNGQHHLEQHITAAAVLADLDYFAGTNPEAADCSVRYVTPTRHDASRGCAASSAALLETFADQAVIAIENARLFNEIQAKSRELETINRQLAEATQHKSTFISSMSHELCTPLNAILGYSEMLQEEAEELGAETMVTDLGKVNAAGKHLLSLINNILDLSKIEAGRMDLYLEDAAPAAELAAFRAAWQTFTQYVAPIDGGLT